MTTPDAVVLVVDDEPLVLKTCTDMLRRSGVLEPYTARNTRSFVAHVRQALAADGRGTSARLREYALGYDWNVTFDRITRFYDAVIEAFQSGRLERLVPEPPERWNTFQVPSTKC